MLQSRSGRVCYHPGGLLSLTVGADGTAPGGVVDSTWFMRLRDQRLPQGTVADVARGDYRGEKCTTILNPYELAGRRGAMLAIGQRVPHCCHRYFSFDPDEGRRVVVPRSPVRVMGQPFPLHPGLQRCGVQPCASTDPDEVQAAHTWWIEQGRPDEQDCLFTVGPDRQTISRPTRPR